MCCACGGRYTDSAAATGDFPVQRSHVDPGLEPAAHAEGAWAGGPPSTRLTRRQPLSAATAEKAGYVGDDLARSLASGGPLLMIYVGRHNQAARRGSVSPGRRCGRRAGAQLVDLVVQWARGFHFGGWAG
jgi:hypothetical protein